jgi:hypothetical protein
MLPTADLGAAPAALGAFGGQDNHRISHIDELLGLNPKATAERRDELGEAPLHRRGPHKAPALEGMAGRHPQQALRVVVL